MASFLTQPLDWLKAPQGQESRMKMAQCWAISSSSLSAGLCFPTLVRSSPTPSPEAWRGGSGVCVPQGERQWDRRIRQGPDCRGLKICTVPSGGLQPHEAPEHLKCEHSELKCALHVKYRPDFKDLARNKKECEIAH